ncbi:lectin, partial [Reticulomyxa filosa]
EHNYLAGPIFGIREDFEGFGICFDTYDNDGSRDNPRIFVIKNEQGNMTSKWDHDHDFQQNLIREKPEKDLMHDCTCDYRLKELVKAIFTYRKGISCLTIQIGMNTKGMHFAVSALTGQVADTHDIFVITSHYLTDKDAYVDDKRLSQYRDNTDFSFARFFFYFWQFLICCVSLYPLYSEFSYFQQLKSNQVFFFFFLLLFKAYEMHAM